MQNIFKLSCDINYKLANTNTQSSICFLCCYLPPPFWPVSYKEQLVYCVVTEQQLCTLTYKTYRAQHTSTLHLLNLYVDKHAFL